MFKLIANHILAPNADKRDPDKVPEWRGIVGNKALGLVSLPQAWTPPFVVVSALLYRLWLEANQTKRHSVIAATAQTLDAHFVEKGWADLGLVIRSSAVEESMIDRGAHRSFELPADYNVESVIWKMHEIFSAFVESGSNNDIALVVQSRVHVSYRGHLSNERRISKSANHWMWEMETPEFEDGRFNTQRALLPDNQRPLVCSQDGRKALIELFRMVGRWCTQLHEGRVHIEWGLGFQSVWLFQLDFEDEQPDDGVNPMALLRPIDNFAGGKLPDGSPIHAAEYQDETGWPKIDKVKDFLDGRTASYPTLYYLTGAEFDKASRARHDLVADITAVAQHRAVCRTDCVASDVDALNLARTDSVRPGDAVAFMTATLANLTAEGVRTEDVCFIFHRFIPAIGAAWALAKPDQQLVRVDTLWGLPDGLQYLPHDTFEFDVRRNAISAELIRYKPKFLQETDTGEWKLVNIARNIARRRSLGLPDLREVAIQTHRIASRLNKPIQIMWFCAIPEELSIGRNVPWFMMDPELKSTSPSRPIAPDRPRIVIRTISDLRTAALQPKGRSVLVLEPESHLFRSNEFLNNIASVALDRNFPVVMLGSVLGHAYYTLERKGVSVVTDTSGRTRVRQRQVFGKLVRDEIPAKIAEHGERANLAQIAKPESRTALVIKLFEEGLELLRAGSPAEVTAELADLLEVVRSLAGSTGASWEEVQRAAEEKRQARGSFAKNVVLIETSWPRWDEPEDNRQQRVIPLKELGRITGTDDEYLLNFPSVIATGANNVITFCEDALRVSVCIVDGGVQIRRVVSSQEPDPQQLEFGFSATD